MYRLKHGINNDFMVGWDLETGEHGMFTHTVQEAVFLTEEDAWNYMDLLERKGNDISKLEVEEL